MSIFICSRCGCIENTATCGPNYNHYDMFKPNISLMAMQGHGDDIYINYIPGGEPTLFKPKDKIMMLCSECNTGYWHGQFNKVYPNDREKEIAKLSKYNMITKYDHPEGLINWDAEEPPYVMSLEEIVEYLTNHNVDKHSFKRCVEYVKDTYDKDLLKLIKGK